MSQANIRVRDLKPQTGSQYPRSFLFCELCGGEYSADAGDYFMLPAEEVMTCCDEPMRLVTKRITYMDAI